MKRILSFFYFYFLIGYCFAQLGGRTIFQFLNLETAPRHAALGGKLVTDYRNNPIAGLYNPASINETMSGNFSVNYTNFLADINYGSFATVYNIPRTYHTFHLGVIYINYGDFDGFDVEGNTTGTFGANEAAVSLGYGYKLPNSNFRIGANIKAINSSLEQYKSFGIAGDIGILYLKEEWNLNIGLSVRNIGKQLTTFADTEEDLPLEINLGISQTLQNAPVRWFLNLQNLQQYELAFTNENRNQESNFGEGTRIDDPSFFNNILRHVNIGAELFPEKAVNIRLGFNFRRAEELKIADQRSFAGLSAGFGLKIGKLKFNYAWTRFNLVGSSNTFGLNLNFGKYQ